MPPKKQTGGLFNFEAQFVQYAQYHAHPGNQLVHILFVPLILWSACVFLAPLSVPSLSSVWHKAYLDYGLPSLVKAYPLGKWFFPPADSVSSLGILLYIAYYLLLEPLTGLLFTPLLLFVNASAHQFTLLQTLPSLIPSTVPYFGSLSAVNQMALVVHVSSWVAQIVSHAVIEKRAPALLDNLFQGNF